MKVLEMALQSRFKTVFCHKTIVLKENFMHRKKKPKSYCLSECEEAIIQLLEECETLEELSAREEKLQKILGVNYYFTRRILLNRALKDNK